MGLLNTAWRGPFQPSPVSSSGTVEMARDRVSRTITRQGPVRRIETSVGRTRSGNALRLAVAPVSDANTGIQSGGITQPAPVPNRPPMADPSIYGRNTHLEDLDALERAKRTGQRIKKDALYRFFQAKFRQTILDKTATTHQYDLALAEAKQRPYSAPLGFGYTGASDLASLGYYGAPASGGGGFSDVGYTGEALLSGEAGTSTAGSSQPGWFVWAAIALVVFVFLRR